MRLILISMMFMCLTLVAEADDQAYALAIHACEKNNRTSQYEECLSIIKGRSFEMLAVKACDRNLQATDLNACFVIIRDQVFQEKALRLCNTINQAPTFNSCLNVIKSSTYDLVDLSRCDKTSSTATALVGCLSLLQKVN